MLSPSRMIDCDTSGKICSALCASCTCFFCCVFNKMPESVGPSGLGNLWCINKPFGLNIYVSYVFTLPTVLKHECKIK